MSAGLGDPGGLADPSGLGGVSFRGSLLFVNVGCVWFFVWRGGRRGGEKRDPEDVVEWEKYFNIMG